MESLEQGGRRREARLPATGKPRIRATVTDEAQGLEVLGEVMDLSRAGVRIASATPMPRDSQVMLALDAPEIAFSYRSSAKVCWTAPAQQGWFLGCLLDERLSADCVEDLAVKGAIERRRDMRQPISVVAKARTELGSHFHDVELVDFSAGGFCAVSEIKLANAGERIMVQIPSVDGETVHYTIRAKVAWSALLDGKHGLGCMFISHHDYAQLLEVVSPGSRHNWRRKLKQYRPTHWRSIATATALLLAMQLLYTTWKQPHVIEKIVTHLVTPITDRIGGPPDESISAATK